MYAVLRFAKLKSRQEVAAMFVHWQRAKSTPNADPAGGVECLLGTCTPNDVAWRLPKKFRSNAVLAMEGVLSASPGYFRPDNPAAAGRYDPERVGQWVTHSLRWLHVEFGDRLASAVLHLDEATPHIHCAVVPLTDKGGLSARELFGPDALRRMQTEYARELAPLGIRRGRKGSAAKHDEVAAYYGRVREAKERLPVSVGELAAMQLWGRTPPALAALQAKAADGERARAEVTNLRDEAARAVQLAEETKRERQGLQDRLRAVPLADVLPQLGYRRVAAGRDVEWIGPAGPLTVKPGSDGRREMFHLPDLGKGGRGAIDLVMLTEGYTFAQAVAWLATCRTPAEAIATAAASAEAQAETTLTEAAGRGGAELVPASREPADLTAVSDHLAGPCQLPAELVQALTKACEIGAARGGGGIVSATFPLRPGAEIGLKAEPIGMRIESIRPSYSYWGQRGAGGIWDFVHPGSCPDGREVVLIGQSPLSAMSTCAVMRARQGFLPELEGEDIKHVIFVAAEGAARKQVRDVLHAAAARGSSVVTAFDADEAGRRLSRLVHEEAKALPAGRITGVSGLVALAGQQMSSFWQLWLLLCEEGAEALRERIAKGRAAGRSRQASEPSVRGHDTNGPGDR